MKIYIKIENKLQKIEWKLDCTWMTPISSVVVFFFTFWSNTGSVTLLKHFFSCCFLLSFLGASTLDFSETWLLIFFHFGFQINKFFFSPEIQKGRTWLCKYHFLSKSSFLEMISSLENNFLQFEMLNFSVSLPAYYLTWITLVH